MIRQPQLPACAGEWPRGRRAPLAGGAHGRDCCRSGGTSPALEEALTRPSRGPPESTLPEARGVSSRPGECRDQLIGTYFDLAPGSAYPPEPDEEVAGARLSCGDEGCPEAVLGGVLRLRGRVSGGRRQVEGGRPDGQVPSGVVPACLPFVSAYPSLPP